MDPPKLWRGVYRTGSPRATPRMWVRFPDAHRPNPVSAGVDRSRRPGLPETPGRARNWSYRPRASQQRLQGLGSLQRRLVSPRRQVPGLDRDLEIFSIPDDVLTAPRHPAVAGHAPQPGMETRALSIRNRKQCSRQPN